jgi:hypothetical protein
MSGKIQKTYVIFGQHQKGGAAVCQNFWEFLGDKGECHIASAICPSLV